jgi:sirohydrochlorin ferrochelatase
MGNRALIVRHAAGLLLLGALAACAAPPGDSAPAPPAPATLPGDAGVLLVAHGGSSEWNALVERAASDCRPRARIAVGFLSHDYGPSAQDAYDTLVSAGARRIVVVPLFVSSHSNHGREVAAMVGLADPAAAPHPGDDPASDHGRVDVVPEFAPVLGLGPALDDSSYLADILADRARGMSEAPSRESVVLVAHGPNEDDDAALWLADLGRVAQRVRERGGYRQVDTCLLRDDAPAEVLEAARTHLRDVVQAGAQHGRVIVVPVLLSQGRVAWQIPEILDGLTYVWDGRTILPDTRIAEWILSSAEVAWEQPAVAGGPAGS